MRSSTRASTLALALALGSCSTPDPHGNPGTEPSVTDTQTPEPTTPPAVRLLTDDELLSRISLDLRGVRPTLEELEAFDGSEQALDADIEAWLHDPLYPRHVEDLFSQVLAIRAGVFYVDLGAFGDRYSPVVVQGHVAEEPMRMVSYLAENDLPYTQLVTGNWTMADEVTADLFPTDYPAGATGWRKASYTDGRPGAGVLTSNSLWWFQGSMANNRNRARANLTSRVFLCDDYLSHELPFSNTDNLGSEEDVANAISTNPSCTVCHQTLDPFAAHFWGFYYSASELEFPSFVKYYHADRENWWDDGKGPPPGYYGQPSNGLEDLGRFVSQDSRYSKCAVQEFWEGMTRRPLSSAPVDLTPVQTAFDDSGELVREAMRAIVKMPEYQGYDERFSRKLATPELVSTMFAGLTGYTWTEEGVDMMKSGQGYAVVAGAADGDAVAVPAPTVSTEMVVKRLSEAAAQFAVRHDQQSSDRHLFSADLTFTETSDDDAGAARIREELVSLQRRMLARKTTTDAPDTERLFGVWSAVYDLTGDPVTSWSAAVSAILRDPDMVMY